MLRRLMYAMSGLALSAGAPVGLLAVRLAHPRRRLLTWRTMATDVQDDRATYGYVSIATAIVFTIFGYVLGRRADALASLAETDPLTGLRNFRGFQQQLQHELSRASRYDEPLSLLEIDLDDLKPINDLYGHQAGQMSLRLVGDVIRHELRQTDVGMRWGGDEFSVIAPNTPPDAAIKMAERMRAAVASARLGWSVTISLGIVTVGRGAVSTPNALIEMADAALYKAKRQGGNCVATAATSPNASARGNRAHARRRRRLY